MAITPTAFKQVADNAITTTATDLTTTGKTALTAASNVFPAVTNGFIATLWNGSDPTLDPNMEKVIVTANSSGILTMSATTKTHVNPTYVGILDAAQIITDLQTSANALETAVGLATNKTNLTVASQVITVPATARIFNITNNAALAVAITLSTSGAVDGQLIMIRFFDFSAVAQALTFVNTENSTVSNPTTSNGSTTLPVSIGYQFNGSTSKWRCIGIA